MDKFSRREFLYSTGLTGLVLLIGCHVKKPSDKETEEQKSKENYFPSQITAIIENNKVIGISSEGGWVQPEDSPEVWDRFLGVEFASFGNNYIKTKDVMLEKGLRKIVYHI